jgi:hypothetical protein
MQAVDMVKGKLVIPIYAVISYNGVLGKPIEQSLSGDLECSLTQTHFVPDMPMTQIVDSGGHQQNPK